MTGPDDLAAALARLEELRGEALGLLGRAPEAGTDVPPDTPPAAPGAQPAPAPAPAAPASPDLTALRAGAEAIVALGRQLGTHLDALATTHPDAPLADEERAALHAEIARRDEALRRIGELVAEVPPSASAPPARPSGTGAGAGTEAELDLDDLVARIEALQRTVEARPPRP